MIFFFGGGGGGDFAQCHACMADGYVLVGGCA